MSIMLKFVVQFLAFGSVVIAGKSHSHMECKAVPGSSSWPNETEWSSLNASISGRLLKPPPPGAVCHPSQPTFDAVACPAVQAGWLTSIFHVENPVSTVENNWNNDTCLPIPTLPCSGEGYPIYVVNATCAEDVKRGVDFAREHNVRLIVKGTGHDYQGRSVAPNSLSIWTYYMQGLEFHDGFEPQGCNISIDTPAVTAMAGTQFGELNLQASLYNLTLVSGGASTVGIGGYITGGGHGAYSPIYGLAADQVLEMEIVTPGGDILTINECQHEDLFWAMRGGGGSTFGVITSITMKAFQSTPFASVSFYMGSLLNGDAFWDAMVYFCSQLPSLSAQGIAGYTNLIPSYPITASNGTTTLVSVYYGAFVLPVLSSSNSSSTLNAAIQTILTNITTTYPFQFITSINASIDDDFQSWYAVNNGPLNGGVDVGLGSRLLPPEVLTTNPTKLKAALQRSIPPNNALQINLVSGKGVWDAKPRGGSNAVNPAWRKALLHVITGLTWTPLDTATKERDQNLITYVYDQALRDLAPHSGAYINEADHFEPNFQHAFWGSNYPRLKEIKRKVDPHDVFWCHPCVGNERWEEVEDLLCRR